MLCTSSVERWVREWILSLQSQTWLFPWNLIISHKVRHLPSDIHEETRVHVSLLLHIGPEPTACSRPACMAFIIRDPRDLNINPAPNRHPPTPEAMPRKRDRQATHIGWRRNKLFYVLLLLGIITWIMLLDDIWLPLYRLLRRMTKLPANRRRREIDLERGEGRRLTWL